MLRIDTRGALRALTRDLNDLKRRQVPFALAQTLTGVARAAAKAEMAELPKVFDGPTPFTGRAFAVIPARKTNLVATLFVKDIQATYLAPYIDGGRQVLGAKRAILTPRDLKTNAYGNIPKGKIAALKGRPDIFIGEVKTRGGVIGGVWQRVSAGRSGRRGRRGRVPRGSGRLRLLIQFTRPAEVTHRFPYEAIAYKAVLTGFTAEWERAFARALATARP